MPILAERCPEDITPHYPKIYKLYNRAEIDREWRDRPIYLDNIIKLGKCIIIEDVDIADAYILAAIFIREIVERIDVTWYDYKTMKLYLCYAILPSKWDKAPEYEVVQKAKEVIKKIMTKNVIYNIVDDFQGYPLLGPPRKNDLGRSGAT